MIKTLIKTINNKKKTITLLIISAVALISIYSLWYISNHNVAPKDSNASTENLERNWLYKKSITIDNPTSTEVNDYALKVNLSDIQKYLKSDCGDLRFTDSNNNILNYWIRKCDDSGVIAHVKVDLKADKNTDPINVYYGNNSAESKSNGKMTFDYFEDFDNFNPTVKFGLITDLHHDTNNKNYWKGMDLEKQYLMNARPKLRNFINSMNNWEANFIVNLGDFITAENYNTHYGGLAINESVELPEQAFKALQEMENEYQKFDGNRYYVHSNHEFYNLSLSDIHGKNHILCSKNPELPCGIGGQGATLNQSNGINQSYYSFDRGGVHFVLIDLQYKPHTNIHRGPEGESDYGINYMNKDQLNWLKNDLSDTRSPIIIFSPTRIDDTDYLSDEECDTSDIIEYCTNYEENPSLATSQCKDFYQYRNVVNKDEIQSVIADNNDRVLAVFQGNEHLNTRAIQDGVHYITVNAADQENTWFVNYLKVEIDPVSKLISVISGNSPQSTYSITYNDGYMELKNNTEATYLPSLLPTKNHLEDDMIVEAEWEITNNNANTGKQFAIGYWRDADFLKIRHRCATTPRPREYTLTSVRKLDSYYMGEGFGVETVINSKSYKNSIDLKNTADSGHLWLHYSNDTLKSWFRSSQGGGFLGENKYPHIPKDVLYPGAWVFNKTNAKVDYFIVRKTVQDENNEEPLGSLN
ncbi:DUF2341 domain-containing protein [Candidatus Dojkabacteria bacterium]|nr:DUF2341 domain-containing protein [Candidatus Dojkabacteria bacterium]